MMKVLGISGTIIGAKPAAVVEKILNCIYEKTGWEVELLDLAKYKVEFCDGRNIEDYSEDTQIVIQKVTEADAYIIGTPIFNGSFPAPLKNVIDLVPPNVFQGKVIGFAAGGGNPNYYLVIENQLKPIAGYLKAYVAPTYCFTNRDSFDADNQIIDQEVLATIDQMVHEVVNLLKVVNQPNERVAF